MIKINLAKKKQAGFAAPGGRSVGKGGIDLDELKEYPILKFGLAILIALLIDSFVEDQKKEEMLKVSASLQRLNQEKAKLNVDLQKTKGFEGVKAQLEKDEFTIKTKIETIEKLLGNRSKASKMFVSLSDSIPEKVWLDRFQVRSDTVNFSGAALSLNEISDFISKLNETAYFADVILKNTKQIKDKSGLEVARFDLEAKKRK